jgi:hypothetical protein
MYGEHPRLLYDIEDDVPEEEIAAVISNAAAEQQVKQMKKCW